MTHFSSPQAAALASGMMDKLGKPGHYTLFAPTNDAFDTLSPGHLERMMADKDVITGMLGSGPNCAETRQFLTTAG